MLWNILARTSKRPAICGATGLASIVAATLCASALGGGTGNILPTTPTDYLQPGTPPQGAGLPTEFHPVLDAMSCAACHAGFGPQDPFLMVEEFQTWTASMMGQSARDPLFHAGLTIANQDAAGAGEYCIRCHAPVAYLSGHASPPDGSAFDSIDLQGVQCNFCHRMVDPVYKPNISPAEDQQILADLGNLGLLPPLGHNSRFVVDPSDVRRGPFSDVPMNIHPGDPQPQILGSPYHSKAEFCWNCHGVSNVLMTKQPDSTYALNAMDAPPPSLDQHTMFPLHRTFEEWKNSYYSSIGVQHNGRFGGNHPTGIMKDCQDCHMPDQAGFGCNFEFDPFFERPNVPQHSFIGSNTWVLNGVRTVDADADSLPDYPDEVTGLSQESVDGAVARNIDFLEKASDLEITKIGPNIRARIINRTGHKLPTGFPDGRRMWLNAKFLDCNGDVIEEHGAYDFKTATLTPNTKVYEMDLGIDGAAYAEQVGHPEGQTFHFLLANKILKDNRIPPAGYSSFLAQQNQTAPVGAVYSNGQHWDDTTFAIPAGTKNAVFTVYYQVTTKEFIEYLRDANTTDNRGQVAYDLWVQHGMSQPVVMDMSSMTLYKPQDINHDGTVNTADLLIVIGAWGDCPAPPQACPADITLDGFVNVADLLSIVNAWGPC